MKWFNMAAALACCATTSAAASETLFACTMTRECIADESCNETNLDLTVEKHADMTGPFQFITPAETIDGQVISRASDSGDTSFLGRAATSVYLLNVGDSGDSVWLVHLPDAEMVITYLGSCAAQ